MRRLSHPGIVGQDSALPSEPRRQPPGIIANALAESVIPVFKTEVIGSRGPGKNLDAVRFATLEWVEWFNHRRLLEPLDYLPPVQFEEEYYRQAAEEEEQALRTAESPMNPAVQEQAKGTVGQSIWHHLDQVR